MSSLLFYGLLIAAASAVLLLIFPLRPVTRGLAALGLVGALGVAAAVLLWPAPGEREAAGKKLIDSALPRYQFAERHQTKICATGEQTGEAIRLVSSGEIRWLELLTTVRGLPRSGRSDAGERPMLVNAVSAGFVMLADTPAELVMGFGVDFQGATRELFAGVKGDLLGFAALDAGPIPKGVFSISNDPGPMGCRLVTTETRIFAADEASAKKFAAYWRVIQPGSAIIRRAWLDAIRRRAEEAK